jgi:CYTH domain-containing protein
MPIEIERKFLLANDGWKSSVTRRIRIRDGLIASNNGNKARVRIADSNATITLKSRREVDQSGLNSSTQFRILTPWKYCERCAMVMF